MRYHKVVRIVLDTNVFISSAIRAEGASREVVRRCLRKELTPLMGAALYAEYEMLLSRGDLYHRSPLTKKDRETLLNAFMDVCTWTRIYYRWRPNLGDETDNHLVELAVAGGAKAIVTKNVRDFRRAELRFPRLWIGKPETFLDRQAH